MTDRTGPSRDGKSGAAQAVQRAGRFRQRTAAARQRPRKRGRAALMKQRPALPTFDFAVHGCSLGSGCCETPLKGFSARRQFYGRKLLRSLSLGVCLSAAPERAARGRPGGHAARTALAAALVQDKHTPRSHPGGFELVGQLNFRSDPACLRSDPACRLTPRIPSRVRHTRKS